MAKRKTKEMEHASYEQEKHKILVAFKRKTLIQKRRNFGSLNGNFVSHIQVHFVMADIDHCKSGFHGANNTILRSQNS